MKNKKMLVIISGLIVLIVAMVGFAMGPASKPSFCTNCHEIEPAVTAWEKSPHKGVDCMECHANPGIIGKLAKKVGGLKEVAIHITSTPAPDEIKGHVDNERCLSCHDDEIKASKKPFHQELKLQCGSCHRLDIHNTSTSE